MTRDLRCKKPVNCAGCYFQALVNGEYTSIIDSIPDPTVKDDLASSRAAPHGRSLRGVIYRRPSGTSWGVYKRAVVEEV